jgi:hypothetical protein
MGATNKTMVAETKEALLANFKKAQEHDRSRYGTDSYSGGWHLIPAPRIEEPGVFKTARECEDVLTGRAEKYEPARVGRYRKDDGSIGWMLVGWSPT